MNIDDKSKETLLATIDTLQKEKEYMLIPNLEVVLRFLRDVLVITTCL